MHIFFITQWIVFFIKLMYVYTFFWRKFFNWYIFWRSLLYCNCLFPVIFPDIFSVCKVTSVWPISQKSGDSNTHWCSKNCYLIVHVKHVLNVHDFCGLLTNRWQSLNFVKLRLQNTNFNYLPYFHIFDRLKKNDDYTKFMRKKWLNRTQKTKFMMFVCIGSRTGITLFFNGHSFIMILHHLFYF